MSRLKWFVGRIAALATLVLFVLGPTAAGQEKGKVEPEVIKPLRTVRWNAGERFSAVDISADGSHFLAARLGAGDRSVRVWETESGKLVKELPGYIARFSPNGKTVISCGDGDFHVVPLNPKKADKEKTGFKTRDGIWNFQAAPDVQRLFLVSENGGEVWHWGKGEKLCDFPFRDGDRVAFTPDGKYILHQAGGKPPLRAYDVMTGKVADAYTQLKDVPTILSVSADGKRLLCVDGKTFKVWDIPAGKEVGTIPDRGDDPWGVLNGNGHLLVGGGSGKTDFGVWRVGSGARLATLRFPEAMETTKISLRQSADGRFAAFFGPTDKLYVFRLPEVEKKK